MSPAKPSFKKTKAATPAAPAARVKKHGRRNPNSRHVRRMLRAAGLKTSSEAKALLCETVAHNISAAQSAAVALASYHNMSTITPNIARAVVALVLSAEDFKETSKAFAAYNTSLLSQE